MKLYLSLILTVIKEDRGIELLHEEAEYKREHGEFLRL